MEAGEYELALKAYYRSAAKYGANAETLSAIGSANVKLGRVGHAEQILRRAVEASEDAGFFAHGGVDWTAIEQAWQ